MRARPTLLLLIKQSRRVASRSATLTPFSPWRQKAIMNDGEEEEKKKNYFFFLSSLFKMSQLRASSLECSGGSWLCGCVCVHARARSLARVHTHVCVCVNNS